MTSLAKNLLSQTETGLNVDIQFWRERILKIVLIVASILGGIIFIINLNQSLAADQRFTAFLYSLLYGWILVITIIQRIPFGLRAGTLLALLFIIGVSSVLDFAFMGDVRVWWLGCSVLATIFFGTWAGIGVAIFNTAAYLVIGWSMNQSIIPSPDLSLYADPILSFPWISTSIPFLAMSILIIVSFGIIISRLESNLQKATSLTTELEQDRSQLNQRTDELERRENQIRTAAEISRTISAVLDPEKILQQVVELVKERFELYYVGVFLLDDSNKFAILRVGSGEAGKKMIAEGHILAVGGTSMIGWAISNRQARIALDVGGDAVHFQNPHLPHTRSELALPMISENKVLGAMSIQSTQAVAFDQDDIIVLQGIADSLAVAIENAILFHQVQDNLEEIRTLHRQYLTNTWADVSSQDEEIKFTFEGASVGIVPPADGEVTTLRVPLNLRNHHIGFIEIEHGRDKLTSEEENLISDIATQTALALENARLVKQTERGAQYNRSVTEINSKVWSSTSVDSILQTALKELGNTLGASDGLIQLHTPESQ